MPSVFLLPANTFCALAPTAGSVLTDEKGAGPEDLGLKLDTLHVDDALCRVRRGVARLMPATHRPSERQVVSTDLC